MQVLLDAVELHFSFLQINSSNETGTISLLIYSLLTNWFDILVGLSNLLSLYRWHGWSEHHPEGNH